INFNNQKYKWRIELENDFKLDKLDKLSVYSDKEEFLCSKDLGIKFTTLNWKILNNNALAIRYSGYSDYSIKIYEYDISNKKIEIKYYYKKSVELNGKDFSGPILPIMSDIEKKDLIKIVDSIIEDDRCFARYGPTLLPILIKSTDLNLTHYIEVIYNKCIKLVKEDPKGKLKFLNIITSSMNDLYEKYPDYITKFNSEMFMILDPSNERIVDGEYSHFYAFSHEEFYSNWNGEAIIRFKWNKFGRAYYIIIWLLFTVFLVCFTIASYPTNSITREIRIKLYQTSTAFGFFHLIHELRQFIQKPDKYFFSHMNLFGKRIFKFIL
ncbi:hypothetical protein RhiirA5_436889, partial [Rhizophagus irregularis]